MPVRPTFAIGVTLIVALALAAGCGDDNGNDSAGGGGGIYGGGGQTQTTSSESAATATVAVTDNADLGEILVDADGNTLYLFEKDKGAKSACYGACASVWPPYTSSGEPKAENGAEASMLNTTKRSDGSEQVTYNDFPLYTYVGDKKPGDTSGNDFEQFGAEWYAVTPQGGKPKD